MNRTIRILIAAMVIPVVLGLVISLPWWALGSRDSFYVSFSLPWLPLVLGALIALALLPALITAVFLGFEAKRSQRRMLSEHAASRRRLLSRLDHEIKNPIQGIRAAIADEPSPRQRASIDAQARRLTGLLSDLRKITELEHTQLELSQVDPSALVAETVLAIAEVPGAKDRRIHVSLPTAPRPLPSIVGDGDLLFLALMNVLTNAVKYSRPGDAIEIRGRAEAEEVVLEIADTGQGIRPEDQQLVWEELGRSRDVHGIEGSGLGLPMVRAIIERHGGKAGLESWFGEGSTITLSLPVKGPEPRRSKERTLLKGPDPRR